MRNAKTDDIEPSATIPRGGTAQDLYRESMAIGLRRIADALQDPHNSASRTYTTGGVSITYTATGPDADARLAEMCRHHEAHG